MCFRVTHNIQERIARAKIQAAQQQHLDAVRAWMSHKMMEEWRERGHKHIKHDKKELKKALADAEVHGNVYTKAIACADVKHPKEGKMFLPLVTGQEVEVMDAMNTPHGLWIIRQVCTHTRCTHTLHTHGAHTRCTHTLHTHTRM